MLTCHVEKTLHHFMMDVHFSMNEETVVIIGHSGCGKSTLLQILAGLTKPDHGHIQIADRLLYDDRKSINVRPEDRHLGFVFQDYALFPHMTVLDNVCYGLTDYKMSRYVKKQQARAMLTALNIATLADRYPGTLSGGEQQRVALARVLVLRPDALLLDEPLSSLDVTTRRHVRRELKKTLSQWPIPKIVVTHDYEDAMSLGDRIFVMDEGQLIQSGQPAELLWHPHSSFVADFSGSHFFRGLAGVSEDLGHYVRLQHTDAVLKTDSTRRGDVSVLIYPWDIVVYRQPSSQTTDNELWATVFNVLPYGHYVRLECEGSLDVTVDVSQTEFRQLAVAEGDAVVLMIPAEAVHLLPFIEKQDKANG